MKKFELKVVNFDNEDVIATSGDHTFSKHFYCTGAQSGVGSMTYKGDIWEYNSSSWQKTSTPGSGDASLQASDFVTPMVGSNEWYYYGTDGKYHTCSDNHDDIHVYGSSHR